MSGDAPLPLKARAEWIRFSVADEASSQAALLASERPVLSRSVLLGGCALLLAFIGQAVWRSAPYAGEAVLFGPLALAAWIVAIILYPSRAFLFHVELHDTGLLLRRQALRLPAWEQAVQLDLAQLRRLELVSHGGAQQVYRGAPALARVQLLLHTTRDDFPLIRVVGLDLPVPQRWSLRQLKDELGRRCQHAGIPVSMAHGPLSQEPGAIRAGWPQG